MTPDRFRFLRLDLRAAAVCAVGAAAAAAAAAVWHQQARQQHDRALAALHSVRASSAARLVVSPASAPAADFVAALPESVMLDGLIGELQRRAGELGLTLAAVTTSAVPPTAQTLGRHTVACTVRGSYAAIVRLLAGLDEGQASDAVLTRLRMQRLSAGADIEAQFEVMRLSRPLRAAGGGDTR